MIDGQIGGTAENWIRIDETPDAALGGTVRIIQPRKGYRFALDSILLARFAAERSHTRVLDLGCGCGVVSLSLVALGGGRQVVGIDLQAAMIERASRSARWNGLGTEIRFETLDLRQVRVGFPPESFDLVVSNPPYRPAASGRLSPESGAALARHEVACTFPDVARAARYLLGTGGEFCVVYPAGRLSNLVAGCRDAGLEPKVLWPVYPRPGEAATLVLVRCIRGGGEGLEIRAPLFLHADDARYSPEAERLLGPP
ncbi:MAG: methyltransferase domain-containing protein [Proteobacteria bacterium]|nr:methyltransferase domain-containing protein [Pseudomonadota bacterium]